MYCYSHKYYIRQIVKFCECFCCTSKNPEKCMLHTMCGNPYAEGRNCEQILKGQAKAASMMDGDPAQRILTDPDKIFVRVSGKTKKKSFQIFIILFIEYKEDK